MSTLYDTVKEEIKMRLSLSSVVGASVKLSRAGREFKACCPFHNEKSPSFYVNDDKQFYHCFGCGAHGDHFGFVMQNEKISFFEALEKLAGQAGVSLPQPEARDIEADKARERLYQVNDEAAKFYTNLLHSNAHPEVMGYVRERGISEDSINNFRLGYAPQDGQALIRHLRDAGFTAAEMIESGLARETDGRVYSFFRDRVLFPVADKRGCVIAFGGRTLPEHLRPPSDKAPKYLNTSDSPLFHKSHSLYAQALARLAANDGQPLIVVEGYMDVIAMHQNGFKGAVAPLGTALTENQIELLWQMDHNMIKEPILAFDGDKAGRSAAVRAMDRALPHLKAGRSLKILFLPEGEDPDTLLLRHGAPALRELLDQAQPLVDFAWEQWKSGMRFDTPEAKAQARAQLREKLNAIADQDVRALYRTELGARLDAIIAPDKRTDTPYRGQKSKAYKPEPKVQQGLGGQEALMEDVLLASVLICPQLVEYVEEQLGIIELSDSVLDNLRQFIISESSNWSAFSHTEAVSYCELKGYGELMTRLLSNRILVHTGFAKNGQALPDIAAGWLDVYANYQTMTRPIAPQATGTSPLDRLRRLARSAVANDTTKDIVQER